MLLIQFRLAPAARPILAKFPNITRTISVGNYTVREVLIKNRSRVW